MNKSYSSNSSANWTGYALVGALCLFAGYLGGRAHLKHEIEQSISGAFGEMLDFDSEFADLMAGTQNPGLRSLESFDDDRIWASGYVVAELKGKKFVTADLSAGDYQDEIELKIQFRNRTGNAINSFTGDLLIADASSRTQLELAVNYQRAIRGKTGDWIATVNYDPTQQCLQWLKTVDREDIVLTLVPDDVYFANGDHW